jgi:hypothetical protein
MVEADELIERLRQRAADPARRTDRVPSRMDVRIAGLGATELATETADAAAQLQALIQSIRATGWPDPASRQQADRVAAEMSTPVVRELAAPVDGAALDRAEASLGTALPPFVRRLYCEIADGAFGPGEGLLPIERVVKEHRDMLEEPEDVDVEPWPARLVPLALADPGHVCIDVSSGAVVECEYEELESADDAAYRLAVREVAPSVEDWLEAWLRP